MILLSERCRLTLESLARLHRDNPEASYKPDLLDGVACGKLTAHGLCDRVSDKPRRYRVSPAGLAWLDARERQAAAPVAPDPRQGSLFGDEP